MLKIHHYAMEVADIKRVSDFYMNFLGFEEADKIEYEGEEILFLRLGDFYLELIQTAEESSFPERIHLCFETASLQETIEKFTKSGLDPDEGPFSLKNGWKTVFYKGPANEIIELLEP